MELRFFVRKQAHILLVLVLLLLNIGFVFGQISFSSSSSSSTLTFHQREILGANSSRPSISLEWNVSLESKTILVTIETQREVGSWGSYVALGLTKNGTVEPGSDVIVTGIGANDGRAYVVDMVTVNNRTAVQDINQNWQLIDGRRLDSGGSRITIQRRFEACDEQDMQFNTNLIHVVWDQGQSQAIPAQLDLNFRNESHPIYFLDPIVVPAPQDGEILNTVRVSRRFLLPPRHTSYWCSMHKTNVTLNRKHHIVGFAPYFENELGRKHVHHQVVFRCIAPPGANAETLFDQFVGQVGEECYINNNRQLPYAYCGEYLYESAVGGKDVPFPDSVGFALGGESSPVEYFIYQTHYDNPEVRADLELETGVDFLYSNRLRPNEGGLLQTGHSTFAQWAMPPKTDEFDLAGHCNPTCTRTMFPPEGVEVLAIRLHAHLNSRRIKIKHFRGDTELPWIQNDDNYDFDFQQWRWLYNPVRLLPGDQVTVHCGFDNTWKSDSASTVSGFSTRDEMCVGWLLISKRLSNAYCISEYPTENTMARFGIQNMTWDLERYDRVIHSATDPQNVGLTLTQLTTKVLSNWTQEQKLELENEQLYGQHYAMCPNYISAGRIFHYYSLIQQELPEGEELPLPESLIEAEVSDKTISSPGRSSTASYPREVPQYVPPSSCPVGGTTGGEQNGNENVSVEDAERGWKSTRGNFHRFGRKGYTLKRKSSVWGS